MKGNHDRTEHRPASTILGSGEQDLDSSGFWMSDELKPEFVTTESRYQVMDELGRGGMGIVYRARDCKLDRMVAVKVLRSEFRDRHNLVQHFLDEAKIMGTLQHPGIASIYEFGNCLDGRPFYSMKLVTGETFNSLLHHHCANTQMTYGLLKVFAQVCQAVAYAHACGIVHLDLKPANVMVGEFGEVYLMDWGLARRHSDPEDPLNLGPLVASLNPEAAAAKKVQGTLEYMSPEQARGEPLDARTDVFCLGAILFQILTGRTIYRSEDRTEMLRLATEADLTNAFEVLEQCGESHPLIRLTQNCLAANPRQRPIDARMLAVELADHHNSRLEIVQSDMIRFFELSLDLFCIAGFDGYFRRINSNFSRVLGYTEDDLLTRPFMDFVHPADIEKTIKVMSGMRAGQSVIRFRNRYLTASGTYLELEWTAKSIMEENTIFAVARNVSEFSDT